MSASNAWSTIESDPGVFTELIEKFGVKGLQVEELWSLDSETLSELKPIYGLIFLFKWVGEKDERPALEQTPENMFYAQQIVTNACATQAILSILMNIDTTTEKVELGEELTQFKSFSLGLPPDVIGETIGASEMIKEAHNSFARPEPFIIEESKKPKKDEDVFHFIAYLPFKGHLYELDGLKGGPILLGECTQDNWLEKVVPEIQNRINKYAQTEIKFNLMAVVRNRKDALLEELNSLPQTPENMDKISILQEKIQMEEEKRANWKQENARRRHNYVPFLVNLLKVLAEEKELLPLIERAKEQSAAKK
ncbi:hypothetical protein FDP41_003864 [Naegleria fowleri]|uniref:Ubiquitin carboxyl-terminal hydrolase n=1 Tax=Naegleria fowleri TaxID=5763 RepID=A0A6A5BSB7_NAEFO|nr:uncharacterized protein FDP41_003864 [Naegleria fowleri]KAF0977211.1 hypothetical protein FDP41_003864 [Naegleria fowleri]CAG4713297.1 unnamed protein product [Naegleria fowleri]